MNCCWEKKRHDPDVKCKSGALLIARCALAFAADLPPQHVEGEMRCVETKARYSFSLLTLDSVSPRIMAINT